MSPSVADLIRQHAQRYGVDPAAALAVASVEGGVRTGAVGDAGTSFGPFQLHVGGALPSGRNAAWANSPAGIEYAVRKISESGAKGLRGPAAIEAIVRNFERPADPTGEIARARARLGSVPDTRQTSGMASISSPARRSLFQLPETTMKRPDISGVLSALSGDDTTFFPQRRKQFEFAPPPDFAAMRAQAEPDLPVVHGEETTPGATAPLPPPAKDWTFAAAAAATRGGSNLGGPDAHRAKALTGWESDDAWDVGVPIGTPIYALGDGTVGSNFGVQKSRPKDGIRLGVGDYWYGHLSRTAVRPGQKVKRGQLLGYSGASENGAAHLHVARRPG